MPPEKRRRRKPCQAKPARTFTPSVRVIHPRTEYVQAWPSFFTSLLYSSNCVYNTLQYCTVFYRTGVLDVEDSVCPREESDERANTINQSCCRLIDIRGTCSVLLSTVLLLHQHRLAKYSNSRQAARGASRIETGRYSLPTGKRTGDPALESGSIYDNHDRMIKWDALRIGN